MITIIFLTLISFVLNQDFYQLLGVDRNASVKEMKTAYRKQSSIYHPDKNPGNKEYQDMFIKITKAYETLTNPEKKQIYDIYGEEGLSKNNLTEQNKQRGQNSYVEMEATLEDFYNGSQKTFTFSKNIICSQCHGTGGKLGQTSTCPKCNGRGQVIEDVNTGMGFTLKMQNTCNRCKGKGIVFKETCPHCRGNRVIRENKALTVTIEKGMKNGEKIIFYREAEQHPDIVPGDIVVSLIQKPHTFFTERVGDDLYANISVNLNEALLKYDKSFKHLDNRMVRIKNDKPIQPFEIKTIFGEGMPIHNFASSKGKLFLKHIVRLPSRLTEEEKQIIREIFE